MDKLPIDLSTLPEPLKSMAEGLDLQMIQNLISGNDPATLSLMMNSMFAMFKDSLPPDQSQALKEMMDNLLSMMNQKKE